MNIPRQPNARPDILSQSRDADSDRRAPTYSFIAPFLPTAVETAGSGIGKMSATEGVTRGPLKKSFPI
jgi:hypothetical protein